MKKATLSILVLGTLITWYSCSKEQVKPGSVNQPPENSRIKTKTMNGIVQTFTYNNEGRLLQVTKAGKATPDYLYTYNGNTILMKRYKDDGSLLEDVTMTLNAQGLVEDYQNALQPGDDFKYAYDDKSRMIKISRFHNGQLDNTTRFTYKDGNMVSDSTISANGTLNNTREYEYYTGVISTIQSEHFGESFWGKESLNPPKKIYYKSNNGSVTSIQEIQPYGQDSQGRISKKVMYSSGSGATSTSEYTYY
ncbi:MAG: hypothetical protein ACO25B_10110 [Chitinophagaceae bacterium]